jgi:hypothetical protein
MRARRTILGAQRGHLGGERIERHLELRHAGLSGAQFPLEPLESAVASIRLRE